MKKNIRILVTGASGKIGDRLVRKLANQGAEVYAYSTLDLFKSDSRIKFIKRIRGQITAEELPEFKIVYHLASQTSAYVARKSVSLDTQTNLIETIKLIEKLSIQSNPPNLIFAGSMTEYGMGGISAINEYCKIDPQTFYDVGKIACEMYLAQFVREGKLKSCTTLRLSNIYGAQSNLDENDRGFLDRAILKAVSGEDINMYGDGNYFRDFLHIDDAVEAFYLAGNMADNESTEVFNIGTGIPTKLKDALYMIMKNANEITGKNCKVLERQFPQDTYEIEKRNSTADSNAFFKTTGWKPKIEFEEGVKRQILNLHKIINLNTY